MIRLQHYGLLRLSLLTILVFCGCTGQELASVDNHVSPDTNKSAQTPTQRVIGTLPNDPIPDLPVIRAPTTVRVQQPFLVTITTFGSSSCITSDGAATEIHELVATITPYVRRASSSVDCTADLAPHPRTMELTFQVVGQATIQVVGRNEYDYRTVREQTVTVLAP